jgi:hypothetical protein
MQSERQGPGKRKGQLNASHVRALCWNGSPQQREGWRRIWNGWGSSRAWSRKSSA